ncbi:kinase-like protein [Epithele typhae]|uniref:kinase-like protein n=1 Tax=Epithele typhae TaxID=378194 RepID=UPI002008A362|nr:kinase-like protein [Epithele typhae]KAH9922009.1 kinase-like protein [Epithele typhae]
MPPTLGPELAESPLSRPYSTQGVSLSRSSTSSSRTFPDNASIGSSPAYSSSSLSIPFEDGEVDVVRVEGLRHATYKLEARMDLSAPAIQDPFLREDLLKVLRTLRASSWSEPNVTPEQVSIQKVSGSLTNAVFFVSCPSQPRLRTMLLRIYGPSSGTLINRSRELHILHVLSSKYHIGPRVYGTFENGRVEEYFDAVALTAADLRDPEVSSCISARMAELHGVDVDAVEFDAQSSDGAEDRGVQLGVNKNVPAWLAFAREVLSLPSAPAEIREGLDLDRFEREWELYTRWLDQKEMTDGLSRRVFSHNDTQYGNLLRMRTLKEGQPAHRQIIVVDFEYASPNPAAFDIANHFHEWTTNYHGPNPHLLDPARYPSLDERRNFYRAYLTHSAPQSDARSPAVEEVDHQAVQKLEDQVRVWSPASHAMWTVWGVVQAREFIEGQDGEPEFNYLGYAVCRMEGFRRELRALSVVS